MSRPTNSSKLSARSDTFRIRAYGEALNAEGEVMSVAWCEAWVQRFPEYFDTENEPWDDATGQTDKALLGINSSYGRRFRVMKFTWLSPQEI